MIEPMALDQPFRLRQMSPLRPLDTPQTQITVDNLRHRKDSCAGRGTGP